MKNLILLSAALMLAGSCTQDFTWSSSLAGKGGTVVDQPSEPQAEPTPAEKHGIPYVYDHSGPVPEIHIKVALAQWNALLLAYDEAKDTKVQIHCDATFIKGADTTAIKNCGLRLRGAATRKRPEGKTGVMHTADSTDWNRCHFQINFHKFVKDDAHSVHGAQKILLRWNHADPAYVREVYCFDLFRRAGAFAGANAAHCKLFIHVDGDSRETYYGVYTMVEPIDDDFVKVRKEEFGSSKGNLWKCRYKATLTPDANFENIGEDNDEGIEYIYELKTNVGELPQAKAQLTDFVTKFNTLEGEEFHEWIAKHCDVQMLLRTYAVNVACGMWDDYWNNMNNYYIYFNSKSSDVYKFYFIPFDYDNSLGNCATRNSNQDQGRHNPFEWGPKTRPLIWKIIQFEDYRRIYAQELLRLVDPSNELMYAMYSIARVQSWEGRIAKFIDNDTKEDCKMEDRPTSGSSHKEYKLTEETANCFFVVKAESIHQYCDQYKD